MPWQSNGGGDRPNPWGDGSRSGGSGGRGPGGRGPGGDPQFDEFIRKSQEQLRKALPGGQNGIWLVLLLVLVIWLGSGIYRVEPNEQGVVLQFGRWTESAAPGLHWHLPYPIETAIVRPVTDEITTEIGSRSRASRGGRQTVEARDESLMLTGDENIVDIKFNIVWRISDLGNFLFNLREPDATVKSVGESVMRELVGKNRITPVITTARGQIEQDAETSIQSILDEYESGIDIVRVQINQSEAPAEVKDAFLDVQRAEADQQRFKNEADAYRRRVLPEARGNAQRLIQQAEAYRAETVARAEGEAARFISVYNEYQAAKDVTRQRIYLETMEQILSGMDKIILDGQAGGGVVPYLPLNELQKRSQGGE